MFESLFNKKKEPSQSLQAVYAACNGAYVNSAEIKPPAFSEKLFESLCKHVSKEIKGSVSGDRAVVVALDKLQQQVKERLMEDNAVHEAYWQGDLAVFAYFMRIVLADGREYIQKPGLQELWPALDDRERNSRYEALIHFLLKQEIPKWESKESILKTDLSKLERELNKVALLMDVFFQDKALSPPTIKTLLKQWLKILVNWLEQLLSLGVSPKEALYKEVTSTLFKMMQALDFTKEEMAPYFSVMRRGCEIVVAEEASKDFYAKKYNAQNKITWLWGKLSQQVSWERYIEKDLIPYLQKDLPHLKDFGEYVFKAAIYDIDERAVLSAYLDAYDKAQKRIGEWKVLLFGVRKDISKQLKAAKKYYACDDAQYLVCLDVLDKALVTMTAEVDAYQGKWFEMSESKSFLHPGLIKEANTYFKQLATPEVKRLRWIEWVQRTCCDFNTTEGVVYHEMYVINEEAGRKYFKIEKDSLRYYIAGVYTMTDFAVSQLPEARKPVLRLLLHIHPDGKHSSLQAIATYCTKYLNALIETTDHILRVWQRGQWHTEVIGPQRGVPKRLLLTERNQVIDDLKEEIPEVENPADALGLCDVSTFGDLRQAYLAYMKSCKIEGGLQKYEPSDRRHFRRVDHLTKLYSEDEGDRYAQEDLNWAKEELYGALVEEKEAKQEATGAKQEAIEAKQETTEARQETIRVNQKLEKAINKSLSSKLTDSQFISLSHGPVGGFPLKIKTIVDAVVEGLDLDNEDRPQVKASLLRILATDPRSSDALKQLVNDYNRLKTPAAVPAPPYQGASGTFYDSRSASNSSEELSDDVPAPASF